MTPPHPLADALAHRVVLLDGGLSTQLEQQGHDISGRLWSARLLRDSPDAIVAAHRAFFAAGSEVATTATYQASFEGFAHEGIDQQETEALLRMGVALARRAAEEVTDRPTWVAASVGPYGAMLADGSEYRGDYRRSLAELRQFHRRRLEVLADSGADVLAIETVPCAAEVEALVAELTDLGVPAWVSLSVDGASTRAGEPVAELFALAADSPSVIAVGINCSTPESADACVPLAARTGKPAVVYPNSGEDWDANARRWVGDGSFGPERVHQWEADGARLVGGCCRVTPAHIAALRTALAP